jgi:uncharacterized BrkB/YihY/UPF0761 family membrane protein
MKRNWIILGVLLVLLVLLIGGVSSLLDLLTQGADMSLPWLLLFWLMLFGIFALVGGIAWLAGWLPRKKKSANSTA